MRDLVRPSLVRGRGVSKDANDRRPSLSVGVRPLRLSDVRGVSTVDVTDCRLSLSTGVRDLRLSEVCRVSTDDVTDCRLLLAAGVRDVRLLELCGVSTDDNDRRMHSTRVRNLSTSVRDFSSNLDDRGEISDSPLESSSLDP
jgi:hypothetical protein